MVKVEVCVYQEVFKKQLLITVINSDCFSRIGL